MDILKISIGQFRLDELTVQAGDIGDRLVLRALGLTGTGVRTVTETELFHLHYHGLGALGGFRTALGKERELRHL